MRPIRSGEVRLMEIVWVGSFQGFMNFLSNTPYPIKFVVPVCASLGAFGGLCEEDPKIANCLLQALTRLLEGALFARIIGGADMISVGSVCVVGDIVV